MEINPSAQTQINAALPVLPMTWYRQLARAISTVGNPALLAIVIVAISAANLNTPSAWVWGGIEIVLTILVPLAFILWLVRTGRVTDFDVYVREQRWRPYVFSLSCALFTTAAMIIGSAPRLYIVILTTIILQCFLMFLINHYWKISAHAAGAASFAIALWQIANVPVVLAFSIVPVIIWSRLCLHRHTFCQTVAGALLGTTTLSAGFFLLL